MPIPFSIPTYIQYGQICGYLAAEDENNFVKNPGSTVTPGLSRLIYDVTTSLQWGYAQSATAISNVQIALYLYELCGKYIQIAARILGQSGGVVIIPGGGQATFAWYGEQFTVGAGQPMEAGDTVIVFNFPRFKINSDLPVVWNSAPIYKTGAIDQRTYGIVSDNVTITYTLSEPVNEGDTMRFQGMYFP